MTDVMIDLETFGVDSDAVICQIGACWFSEDGTVGREFICNVDVNRVQEYGFKYSGSAIQFWLKQPKEAQETLFNPEPISINDALLNLNTFLAGSHSIWSHSNFDFVILMNAFKKMDIKPSFSYRTSCDIRTLNELTKRLGYKKESGILRDGIHHNGLDDSKFQVKYVCDMLQYLRGLKGHNNV